MKPRGYRPDHLLLLVATLLLGACWIFSPLLTVGAVKVSSLLSADRSLLLCAYNRSTDGFSELDLIDRLAYDKVNLSSTFPYCESAYAALLPVSTNATAPHTMNVQLPPHKVLIVVTGIAGIRASRCTNNLLEVFRQSGNQMPKQILWSGTAGISPVLGGGMDPSSKLSKEKRCAPVEGSTSSSSSLNPTILPLGSVCVTAMAQNQQCGNICPSPNNLDGSRIGLCHETPADGCRRGSLFSQHQSKACTASVEDDLSQKIQKKLKEALEYGLFQFPDPLPLILNESYAWWNISAETAFPFAKSQIRGEEGNKVFTPQLISNCLELDARSIWVGPDVDYECRRWSAEALTSAARGSGSFNASSVACVSAMEGYGFLGAIDEFKKIHPEVQIPPVANIRAGSDWVFSPVFVQRLMGVKTEGDALSESSSSSFAWFQNGTYATLPFSTTT